MTAKHTPGPWGVECGDIFQVASDSGLTTIRIAQVSIPTWAQIDERNIEEADANAQLIAAAPDLLKAIKRIISESDRDTLGYRAAKAAIAKAEGKGKA